MKELSSPVILWAMFAGLAVALGALVTSHPPIAIVGSVLALVLALALALGARFSRLLLAAGLGGCMILGYGFDNIGVVPGVPFPAADAIIVAIGLWVVLNGHLPRPLPASFIAGGAYVILATLHLVIDYPTWHTNAIRDYTLAVELLALPSGYWALRRFGLSWWIRCFTAIFLILLPYALLFPWRSALGNAGPTFGLQRPVALLGAYSVPAVASGFLFFALVKPFGSRSLVLAALYLPALAFQQSRGLVIALPAVLALVILAGRSERGESIRKRALTAVAVGALALAIVFPLSLPGRLGPTNSSFLVAQIGTLTGAQGPAAGTITVRKQWFHDVTRRVANHPYGWLTGLGLGPDLTNGFHNLDAVLVRKPHDDYLEAYARLGIGGLAFLTAALLFSILPILRGARRLMQPESSFLWWIGTSAIVYALISATQPLLAFPDGTLPLFAMLGIGLSIVRPRSSVREH